MTNSEILQKQIKQIKKLKTIPSFDLLCFSFNFRILLLFSYRKHFQSF